MQRESPEIGFDNLVILDFHALVNLPKLERYLSGTLGIPAKNGHILMRSERKALVWGRFDTQDADSMVTILGYDAIPIIQKSKTIVRAEGYKNTSNVISKAVYHFRRQSNPQIFIINDEVGIVEWINAIESVPKDDTFAVGKVYQFLEYEDLTKYLSIEPTPICRDPTAVLRTRPSIAVTTSSFVYEDMCMLEASVLSGENKRAYARDHGYAFVARSIEFAQQVYRNRKTVWGKLDAIEKVLPRYDWVFWMDMDAVIMNPKVRVDDLLERFEKRVGSSKAFANKHLIIARPLGDKMINAGVFMIRNSDWSRKFLREVQGRREGYYGKFYEQKAMWDVVNEDQWKEGVLLLDQDDHTFNTFPKRYLPGDFVVHYAPDRCPAAPVIKAVGKAREIAEGVIVKAQDL